MAITMMKACFQIFLAAQLLQWAMCERNVHRKELIQDTVRKLLGVRSSNRTVPGRTPSMPPRYMMDLYERYRSGQSPMQGNTVRSILAMRDAVDGVDTLTFNLTGLKSTEQILQSKIYILKRKKPKSKKKRDRLTFTLTVTCLTDKAIYQQVDSTLNSRKAEWHSYDISQSVISCRQSKKGEEHLLGVTLEAKRPRGRHRHVAFKRLVKPNSQPFVLIFSEDSQNLTNKSPPKTTQDELSDLLRAKAEAQTFQHALRRSEDHRNNQHSREKRHLSNLRRTPADNIEEIMLPLKFSEPSFDFKNSSQTELLRYFKHAVRNVHNLLSAVKRMTGTTSHSDASPIKAPPLENSIEHFKISVASNKFSQIYGRSKRSYTDKLRYTVEKDQPNVPEKTLNSIKVIEEKRPPNPDSQMFPKSQKRKRKKARKRKKKPSRNRKLPFWWIKHDSRLHAQDMKQLCQRKSLTVDFSQMGWDDWIISPKSFNAHYCAGSCSFPLIKNAEPSNHAAIQSLIYAMGIKSEIPTPCCIPSVTSSLTLLYFDEHGGLVLKNYPDMIVQKCACR